MGLRHYGGLSAHSHVRMDRGIPRYAGLIRYDITNEKNIGVRWKKKKKYI
jgi:hypothetical protein